MAERTIWPVWCRGFDPDAVDARACIENARRFDSSVFRESFPREVEAALNDGPTDRQDTGRAFAPPVAEPPPRLAREPPGQLAARPHEGPQPAPLELGRGPRATFAAARVAKVSASERSSTRQPYAALLRHHLPAPPGAQLEVAVLGERPCGRRAAEVANRHIRAVDRRDAGPARPEAQLHVLVEQERVRVERARARGARRSGRGCRPPPPTRPRAAARSRHGSNPWAGGRGRTAGPASRAVRAAGGRCPERCRRRSGAAAPAANRPRGRPRASLARPSSSSSTSGFTNAVTGSSTRSMPALHPAPKPGCHRA